MGAVPTVAVAEDETVQNERNILHNYIYTNFSNSPRKLHIFAIATSYSLQRHTHKQSIVLFSLNGQTHP